MKTKDLKFPIFSFGKIGDNMIYVCFNENDFCTASLSILKSEDFNNEKIIDSRGNVFYIKKANFVKYKGLFGYTSLLSTDKQVVISYEYHDKTDRISLENFKKQIIPMVENMKDIWEEAYGDIEELKTLITKSVSFVEIAELLG